MSSVRRRRCRRSRTAAAAVDLIEQLRAARARRRGPPVSRWSTARGDARRRPGREPQRRLFVGVKKSPVQMTPGTAAVQVPDEIGVDPADIVLPRYHGLGPMTGHATRFDPAQPRRDHDRRRRRLGDIGMTNLAFDAVNRGYQIVMPRDAIAGVPPDYADAVIDNTLSLVATITTTAEILATWGRARG